MAVAYCFRSGEIEIAKVHPPGTVLLIRGPQAEIERRVNVHARHSYDGKTMLVPGLPEAETHEDAQLAVINFQERLSLGGKPRRAKKEAA